MSYYESNQSILQVSPYNSLKKYLEKKHNKRFRELVVIPPTFMYGKRKMQQLFQEALTVFHNKGHPKLCPLLPQT